MTIAWLFPGQGSQSVGMGKDVLAASAKAREVFERVDSALGEPLSRLILEGPEDELTLTANAQPAIVATSIAVLEAIRERVPGLPQPAFAAGHSLGEYSALVAAGALSLEDAVRVVRARGLAMQDAVPSGVGAMTAIMGLDADRVDALCAEAAQGEVVSSANFNAPSQIVIAGAAAAVARASDLAAAAGGRTRPLKVSAPFHCALMAPAARAVEAELARVEVGALRFPVVANVDAQPNLSAARAKEVLVRELGPGKVLAGLVKRIAKELAVLSVTDAESLEKVASFLSDS